MLALYHRARPVQRLHDAGTRLAATAWRRWFLDRHAEFWLRELGLRPSLAESRARVVDVIDETADTRTLVLALGRGWPGHRAGQYVPIEVEVAGVRVRRCYSISSGSAAPGARRIAITVRRVPGGRVSNALHQLRRGAVLGVGEPAGSFVIDPEAGPKLLLVAGGSGITPIMAMLRDLAERAASAARGGEALPRRDATAPAGSEVSRGAAAGRRAPQDAGGPDVVVVHGSRSVGGLDVVVVHGSRSAGDAIFGAELASLATRFPWLRVHARRDDESGRLDVAALRALVPDLGEREVFVCGPPGLLDVVTAAAQDAGTLHRLHHERFVAAPAVPATAGGVTIALVAAGTRVVAEGPGPLLAQLERAGERPAYGCRIGICNTCRCRKRAGTVEDVSTGIISSEPDQDIRLCTSIARSDLELEL